MPSMFIFKNLAVGPTLVHQPTDWSNVNEWKRLNHTLMFYKVFFFICNFFYLQLCIEAVGLQCKVCDMSKYLNVHFHGTLWQTLNHRYKLSYWYVLHTLLDIMCHVSEPSVARVACNLQACWNSKYWNKICKNVKKKHKNAKQSCWPWIWQPLWPSDATTRSTGSIQVYRRVSVMSNTEENKKQIAHWCTRWIAI